MLEKALDVEPIAKPVGPGTCRQGDLSRAESVPARGIDVQFGGDSQFLPGDV